MKPVLKQASNVKKTTFVESDTGDSRINKQDATDKDLLQMILHKPQLLSKNHKSVYD